MQHSKEHPSNRLASGTVHDFTEALVLVIQQLAHERVSAATNPDVGDPQYDAAMDAMADAHAEIRHAVEHAGRAYQQELDQARLRTAERLREDANAAEAALEDEAARWLVLLADALEKNDFTILAI